MRKPRNFDAELKALEDKARDLKSGKVQQLGELVIATGADSLGTDELAGALIFAAKQRPRVPCPRLGGVAGHLFQRPVDVADVVLTLGVLGIGDAFRHGINDGAHLAALVIQLGGALLYALFQFGGLLLHAVEQARASLGQARADAAEARAKLATGAGGVNPQVEAAKVQRAQAEVNLGRTEVRAPSAGRVAESDRLQLGQMMVAGLPAVTLVDTAHPWVDANFKETDLAHMCAGQRAEMRFDAYPGLVVRGHVQTIGAGTGSEFSVLPAQNATGNWVKVTQRVPVRIAFDEVAKRPMIAGLSTEVKVITSDGCK